MESKIYTTSEGKEMPVEIVNNFQLVNGLVKDIGLCAVCEGEVNLIAQENVAVLKDELFKRLIPKTAEEKNALFMALDAMDEMADRGASEEGGEKEELQKNYEFLVDFIKGL
jgi:hypothetical protein